jgi:mersacidin/lichenicidin family type 2 lantibiotic
MNTEKIIRAWKDADYRAGLNEGERKLLPEHPAGIIEIRETEMDAVAGGATSGHRRPEAFITLNGGTCKLFGTGCVTE